MMESEQRFRPSFAPAWIKSNIPSRMRWSDPSTAFLRELRQVVDHLLRLGQPHISGNPRMPPGLAVTAQTGIGLTKHGVGSRQIQSCEAVLNAHRLLPEVRRFLESPRLAEHDAEIGVGKGKSRVDLNRPAQMSGSLAE